MTTIKTDTQIKKAIRAAKDQKRVYHAIDGYAGLRLRIRGDNAEFQHRYSHPLTAKRKEMTLGHYPALTLELARLSYNDNLSLLAQGIDPITHRDNERIEQINSLSNTFEAVADDWLKELTNNSDHQPATKTLIGTKRQIKLLNASIGKYPVSEITIQQVLTLCRDIQKTHVDLGNRVKTLAQRIFAHAVLKGHIQYNPVLQLAGVKALRTGKTKHRASLTDPKEYAILLNEIDELNDTHGYNKPVLQLLALTFVRIGDMCAMRWADIDLNNKEWILEPQKGQGRGDMVDSVVIPLAPQAIAILEQMQSLTADYEHVFHNTRRKKAPYHHTLAINKLLNEPSMNRQGIGKGYEGKGYKSVHTPHGFRASAKTMLMERLGYDELLTEIQLGHQMLNKYGRAYNRMQAMDKRKQMMTDWANYLDDIKAVKFDSDIHADFKKVEKN